MGIAASLCRRSSADKECQSTHSLLVPGQETLRPLDQPSERAFCSLLFQWLPVGSTTEGASRYKGVLPGGVSHLVWLYYETKVYVRLQDGQFEWTGAASSGTASGSGFVEIAFLCTGAQQLRSERLASSGAVNSDCRLFVGYDSFSGATTPTRDESDFVRKLSRVTRVYGYGARLGGGPLERLVYTGLGATQQALSNSQAQSNWHLPGCVVPVDNAELEGMAGGKLPLRFLIPMRGSILLLVSGWECVADELNLVCNRMFS